MTEGIQLPADPPPVPVSPASNIPVAATRPADGSLGWYWLLPMAAAGIVALVLGLTWSRGGAAVTLRFQEGHGLKPGDSLRCRGIVVGEVRSVRLDPASSGVVVHAELRQDAIELARAGSRFWIARATADLNSGLRGLDTVVGAKYVLVYPGGGAPQYDFVGLEAPPVPDEVEPGGLELVLQADRLGGLRPGAPVLFRQVRIGSVLRVVLASDASAVDVHAYVRPAYARLVRQRSVFWNTSGVRLSVGLLAGLEVAAEAADTLLTGGISLATPPDAGPAVQTGARFPLASEARAEWAQWRPTLNLTDARLPARATPPRPVAATLLYRTSGYLWGSRSYSRRGLVVPLGRDLLGPADLVRVPVKAVGKGELGLDIQPAVTVSVEPGATEMAIGRVSGAFDSAVTAAPLLRVPTEPEDCLLVRAGEREGRQVSVARLKKDGPGWLIEADLLKDTGPQEWHGAAVVAVCDGQVIGLVWAPDRTKAVVVPLDEKVLAAGQ